MAPRTEATTTPLPRPDTRPPPPAPAHRGPPRASFAALLKRPSGAPGPWPPLPSAPPPLAPLHHASPQPPPSRERGERIAPDRPGRGEPPEPAPEEREGPLRTPEPLERALWQLRPPAPPPPTLAPAPPGLPLSVDQLADRLLRRIALGGSRHRGTAYLEVGAGGLQGAAITVHAEGARLSIEIDAPDSEASRRWGHQLQERLRARGLEAEVVLR
jgi:hypothetical protein